MVCGDVRRKHVSLPSLRIPCIFQKPLINSYGFHHNVESGVPATHVNVRALYDEELNIKLRWFYSQIAQLSTDKRIRIILNRRTVLHDTLLAFATLTKEDMAKQIRLQFNGEVSS